MPYALDGEILLPRSGLARCVSHRVQFVAVEDAQRVLSGELTLRIPVRHVVCEQRDIVARHTECSGVCRTARSPQAAPPCEATTPSRATGPAECATSLGRG